MLVACEKHSPDPLGIVSANCRYPVCGVPSDPAVREKDDGQSAGGPGGA